MPWEGVSQARDLPSPLPDFWLCENQPGEMKGGLSVHVKMLTWDSQKFICPFNKDFFRIYYTARFCARHGEDKDK